MNQLAQNNQSVGNLSASASALISDPKHDDAEYVLLLGHGSLLHQQALLFVHLRWSDLRPAALQRILSASITMFLQSPPKASVIIVGNKQGTLMILIWWTF